MFESGSLPIRRSLIWCFVFVASVSTTLAETLQQGPEEGNPAPVSKSRPASALRVGDKVDLAVFERLGREEDKWSDAQQRLPDLSRNFFQRAELSGLHLVQDDGTISLPFLKQIPAAGGTYTDLETAVAQRFEQVFHRGAFVSVLAIEHNPIFIVGPVKNPGSYKYVAGMTVLHAVALAGGTERAAEMWQAIEAAREETKVEQSVVIASRVLARQAVLRSERDGANLVVPIRLIQIVGNAEAAALVNDELALRRLVLATRRAKDTTLRSAVESAKSELAFAKDRIAPVEANITLRNDRLKAMASLSSTGVASKSQLVEVQNSLLDAEARKQELVSAVAAAKRKLEQAEEELLRFGLENQTQLYTEIAAAEKEISDNLSAISHGRKALKAFDGSGGYRFKSEQDSMTFEILRRSAAGTQIMKAESTTELEPGDLVRIKIGENPATEQAQLEGH